ncbi:DUF3549 family protein [Shewanella schlegeliana]|uniref:DUF3549 family protein n=1 Tax=Shewanella schlegeliana TaxID=190308 RepID=A0ABS1T0T1_9GAMM|nr:DUF3549 family protein [Shewanella schlegeliana]MBL4913442.1 DUF3549 family protein [Shewanella schlegeliana]MCL1108332.1 DUF3549 family protein [Shewanella schlegeliana]GIU34397.1 hypothetical protein TUM4433_30430 [Shewanella schlegeliana]
MTEITTLSQFLKTANTQFQVYDMGRRVQHIDMMAFHQIEELHSPYPAPIQGHAQFAIVFWDASQQHYIWFIKLPLDERGLLSPAPRTQFIKMIVEALGRDPTQALTEQQQDQLANHPFNFKPTQEKLAVFNALVRKQLGGKASPQYEFAYQYLSGQHPTEDWQNIGLQGIADVCVRASELDHQTHLTNGFNSWALEVQIAVCQCLEHLSVDEALAKKILAKLETAEDKDKGYFLRALASHPELSQQAIAQLSDANALSADMLITIAARNWSALKDEQTLTIYLEALAKQPQHFFNQIFADIVAIPLIRTQLLAQLRNPNRSTELATAIGGLFKVTKG